MVNNSVTTEHTMTLGEIQWSDNTVFSIHPELRQPQTEYDCKM